MQSQKQQIQSSLQTIFSFDLTKLYAIGASKQPWNNYSDWDLKKYVMNILSLLKKIQKNDSFLDYVGIGNLNTLISHLQNLINSFQNNSGIFNTPIDQITTHHHDPLNWMENINTLLRNSGMYSEIEISSNQIKNTNKSFLEIQSFLDDVVDKKPTYESALIELQGLLNKQWEVNTATLNGQADAFKKRAEEYMSNNFKNKSPFWGNIVKFWKWNFWKEQDKNWIWWWLLWAFVFAITTWIITISFIKDSSDVSTGWAIMRIASIIVPSYLTVFCASQYLYGKKIYESYMFKYASLQTMNNLIQTNSDLKEKILSRWLDVLFSEPNTKASEWSKEEKLIVSELLSMLKWQLK